MNNKIDAVNNSFLLKLGKDISDAKVEIGLENDALRIDHENFLKEWNRCLSLKKNSDLIFLIIFYLYILF